MAGGRGPSHRQSGVRAVEKILLTAEEAAEVLGVGKSTVYDLMRMRLLRSVQIGRSRRIPVHACQELVDRLLGEDVPA
jgi:excisionase family DNA binding protein